jgi:hypothetical protein
MCPPCDRVFGAGGGCVCCGACFDAPGLPLLVSLLNSLQYDVTASIQTEKSKDARRTLGWRRRRIGSEYDEEARRDHEREHEKQEARKARLAVFFGDEV